MDIYQDYLYLFSMCGAIILTGGLFLLVMNVYNYHLLHKEEAEKEPEQNQKDLENPEQEAKEAGEAVKEQAEPKAEADVGSQKSSD